MHSNSISILHLLFFFLMATSPLSAKNLIENGEDFEKYQGCFSKEEVEYKIRTALQKDKEVSDFYSLEKNKLLIFSSLAKKISHDPEFTLNLGHAPKPKTKRFSKQNPHTPLKGIKVAIDPGHIGGEFCRLEERYIHMKPQKDKGIEQEIFFNEGELAVQTATKLAAQLKLLGAEVLLTKEESGKAVYPKEFSAWLEENFDEAIAFMITRQDNPTLQKKEETYWREKASSNDIFRSTYNFLDIKERAQLINDFKPDVTVTCHYNLGWIYDKEGYTPGTDTDYTLFFVPGAFKKGNLKHEKFKKSSLKSADSRYEFIRLLVTDDIEQSISLAEIAKEHAKDLLDLPTGDDCNYLKVLCLKNQDGIYHRNLSLSRGVHGPLLYCEPFCQDNFKQAKRLSENPEERIDTVVELYVRSIVDWVRSNS